MKKEYSEETGRVKKRKNKYRKEKVLKTIS